MVDTYGRWSYFADEPEDNWCDLDRLAHWVEGQGYRPQTSIENLVHMLAAHLMGHLESEDRVWNSDALIEDVSEMVECTGTLRDFDYYC